MTLFLLNGPPRSGKDTAARLLGQLLGEGTTTHAKLAKVLKERTHALYGLIGADGRPWDAGSFEARKEEPREEFLGLTPRQAYINVHELYLKPMHGPRILGDLLIRDLERSGSWTPHLAVSDAGDDQQCLPLVERFGAENTVLVHLDRIGCQWDNRRRFVLPGIRTIQVDNPGSDFTDFRLALVRALA